MARTGTTAHAAATVPGWFGKLPSLGDFAHRRLSARFIAAWDDWLQACLVAVSAEAHDSDRPLPAVPLRFWLGPKLCDERPLIGVIVASRDRVGRRFPLTLVAVADSGSPSAGLDRAWFDQAESTMDDAVVARISADEFDAALRALPPLDRPLQGSPRNTSSGSLWWTAGSETMPSAFPSLPPIEACVALFGALRR